MPCSTRATRPRPGAHLTSTSLKRISTGADPNVSGPEFNGVLFINGEGDNWHEVDGKGDNCWNAVTSRKGSIARFRSAWPG